MICVTAAMERSKLTTFVFGFLYGRGCQMRLLFIGPSCAVLQIQVEFTDIMHRIAARTIVVIILIIGRHSLPERVLVRQRDIQFSGIDPINQFAT